jgi:hypothetical protein
MHKFSETIPTTLAVVDPKGVIELDCESFAPPKKIMLPTNHDCETSDAIFQPVKKIVKMEK